MADQGTSLLERLESRATVPTDPIHHNLNYNYPLAWYRRPDGDIVQLQSDPNNRAMYEDLGFVLLRPSEAREWETQVRPNIILEQKKKARLVTAIRKLETTIPQLVLDEEENFGLAERTVDELQEIYDDYCSQFGIKPRLPALKPEKTSTADGRLAGVESNETMSKEALEGKLQRGAGYDPLREARRR